jgi:hypothetical protein
LHSATLELDLELATLRGRELLELAEPAFERRDSGPAVFAGVAVQIPLVRRFMLPSRVGIEGP